MGDQIGSKISCGCCERADLVSLNRNIAFRTIKETIRRNRRDDFKGEKILRNVRYHDRGQAGGKGKGDADRVFSKKIVNPRLGMSTQTKGGGAVNTEKSEERR